ncbi:hypothetical protein MKW98_009140 [Papaver atlanticum]|uniref:Uncharacterized protein n=1 Tax=Papaver atlanticum TaxID=357466 RepID=A0AAD4T802_9MAGN|nr:hypothetical protein MKW98_009140 [Papaver atlanticum]
MCRSSPLLRHQHHRTNSTTKFLQNLYQFYQFRSDFWWYRQTSIQIQLQRRTKFIHVQAGFFAIRFEIIWINRQKCQFEWVLRRFMRR